MYANSPRFSWSVAADAENIIVSTLPRVLSIILIPVADPVCDNVNALIEEVGLVPVMLPVFANILVDVAFVNAPGATLVTNRELPPSAKYFWALIEVKNSNWLLPERKDDPNVSL